MQVVTLVLSVDGDRDLVQEECAAFEVEADAHAYRMKMIRQDVNISDYWDDVEEEDWGYERPDSADSDDYYEEVWDYLHETEDIRSDYWVVPNIPVVPSGQGLKDYLVTFEGGHGTWFRAWGPDDLLNRVLEDASNVSGFHEERQPF